MTNPASVFDKQEQQQQAPAGEQQAPLAQAQPNENPYGDQLAGIQTEDGRQKYGTVDKALEALAHSQTFIPTLQSQVTQQESELAQLREELAKHKGVQEVVTELTNHQQQGQEVTPQGASFGEDEVARLIEATLEKRNLQQTAASNSSKVNDTLVSTFGEKASEVVQAKAKELNTTPEALGVLAEKQPDMVLALFQAKTNSPSLTGNSRNLGFQKPKEESLGRPEKSLLSGCTTKDQAEYMRKVKEEVYRKFGVTE